MAKFDHQVPFLIRAQSRWDVETNVYVTPDERAWCYIDPGLASGHVLRSSDGADILVACWITGQEHQPFARCLTKEQTDQWLQHLAYHDPTDPYASCPHCPKEAEHRA